MNTQDNWICDSCRQPITKVEDGWVEWLTRSEGGKKVGRGLRLVHRCSAYEPTSTRCLYNQGAERAHDNSTVSDLPLEDFVGSDGLLTLLSFIDEDEVPAVEVAEMIKRLHVPGYEHARVHFATAMDEGVFEPDRPGYYSMQDIKDVLDFARNAD